MSAFARFGIGNFRGQDMLRINGHYLYEIGKNIFPLSELKVGTRWDEALIPLYVAEGALEPLIYNSVFRFKTCQQSGAQLVSVVRMLLKKFQDSTAEAALDHSDIYALKTALDKFEAVFGAELNLSPLYLVIKKRGYDVEELVAQGESLFPDDLPNKVPEAVTDIQQATKCLAFELPTACGFHLHRATESVIRRYYDAVTDGAARPANRNIGDYLSKLKNLGKGDAKVLAALKDLKDLHRNPLVHPEHTLESADEAVALLGGVQAVIIPMLKEIPIQLLPGQTPPAQDASSTASPKKGKGK